MCVSRASSKMAIASAREPATGLSMNTGLCAENGPRLFQVRPAVHTFQEDDVNGRQQLVDRVDDRHPEFVMQVPSEARDAVTAGADVWAPTGKRRHDANADQPGLWVARSEAE